MRPKKRKQDKKSLIEMFRRYLNGEDLVAELLPDYDLSKFTVEQLKQSLRIRDGLEPITGFVFVHAETKEPLEDRRSLAPHEIPIAWNETRTYQDSQFPDVRMTNPVNASVELPELQETDSFSQFMEMSELPETPKNGLKTIHRRLYLEGINEQMKQDKVRRDKMNQWTMMNGSLRPF